VRIETKVGLSVIIGIIILIAGIIWKSNLALRSDGYVIIGSFKTVSGLLKGSEVRYRGYLIGNVAEVTPGPDDIRVYMYVQRGIRISEGSKLRVDFDGLIGEKYLSVIPNTSSKVIISSGAILKGYAASGIVDFIDAGTDNLNETKQILEVLRKIITSEDSQNSMQGLIVNINKISERLDSVLVRVDNLMNQSNVNGVITNINSVVSGLNQTVKSLNHLAKTLDTSVGGDDVKAIVTNLKVITEKMNNLTGSLAKDKDTLLKDITPVLANTNEMMVNVKHFSANLNKTTAGLSEVSINAQAKVFNNSTYEIGGGIGVGRMGMDVSVGNEQNNNSLKLKEITYSTKVGNNIKAKVGLVNFQPGIKVDVPLGNNLTIENALFNPNNLSYMIRAKLQMFTNIKSMLGIEQNAGGSTFIFGVGIE